jgi:transposase-like protein
MDKQPKTLLEAVAYFSDTDRADQHFALIRWPNGIACPRMGCGSADIRALGSRRRWRCRDCKRDFTAKVGTIFEDSPLPLTKWLPAVWLLANAKNGISSCELARSVGVTQKTAWFMLHRIRVALNLRADEPMTGVVEADETFIGGHYQADRDHHGRARRMGPRHQKTTVLGMVQRSTPKRKSRVRAMVVSDTNKSELWPRLFDNIRNDATVTTDAATYYTHLDERFYRHEIINHAIEYVRGNIHTNSIESFWNLLKRSVKGTYIRPEAHHLDAYVAEQVFRFNEREGHDGSRFRVAAKAVDGKRLTYRDLIEKNPARVRLERAPR